MRNILINLSAMWLRLLNIQFKRIPFFQSKCFLLMLLLNVVLFPFIGFSQNRHEQHENHINKNTDAPLGTVKLVDIMKRDNGQGEAIIVHKHRNDPKADRLIEDYISKTRRRLEQSGPGKQVTSSGCANLDFEDGNFTNWVGQTGVNSGYPAGSWVNGIVAGRHSIVSSGSDTYATAANPIPLPAPGGGTYSVKLGNNSTDYEAEQLIYTFTVQPADTNFIYKYAVILEDPAHSYIEQPYFDFTILDQNNQNISCSYQHYVAGSGLYGFLPSGTADVSFKPWTTVGINLSSLLGQTITIIATTADCSQGAHFGYAYIDFACITPATSSNIYCDTQTSATLTAPSFEPSMTFNWSTGETSSTITINPQLYADSLINCFVQSPTSSGLCGFYYTFPIQVIEFEPEFGFTTGCLAVSCTDSSTINAGTIQSWLWNFGDGSTATTQNASHSYGSAGTYNVTLTISTATCGTKTVTHSVTVGGSALVMSATNIQCFGGSNGTATVTATGAPPYVFTWSPFPPVGQGTNSISGLSAGLWTVQFSDQSGCSATDTIRVTQPVAVVASVPTKTNVLCFGANTGSATAAATGGTAPYNYSWNTTPAQSGITATGLIAGTWTVNITDAHSCVSNATVTIAQPAQLVVSIPTQTNVKCFGGSDGTATATVAGGTGTCTYLWNDPAPAQTTIGATGLSAGIWNIVATDSNNCVKTASVTITQPAQLVASIPTQTNITCNGSNDGIATASAVGGTGAYSYLWNDPAPAQTTNIATGLAPGPWSCVVTDINLCTATATVTITEPAILVATITNHTNVNCFGGNNGNATVLGSGGTLAYTYSWGTTPLQTSTIASNLIAGSYCVTVKDSHQCTDTACVTISEPTAVTAQISTTTMVSCKGGHDGTSIVIPGGGVPSYTYLWSNGQVGASVNNLPAGTHTVTVKDSHNCSATASVTITEPTLLTATTTPTGNLCFGDLTGSAIVTPTGGTPGYTYLWSNTQSSQNLTGVLAGTYLVTVTDTKACSTIVNVTIMQPTAVTAFINSSTNVSCFGGSDGKATVAGGGGTPGAGYTYSWDSSPIQLTATALGLMQGTYSVVVTDANMCSATTNVTITEPSVLIASTTFTNVSCFNGSNGTINLSVIGGTIPYTYQWSNSQTTQDVNGLTAGTHIVNITDAKACTTSVSTIIDQPTAIVTATGSVTNLSCYGGSDGKACVLASGGTPPYVYSWSANPAWDQSCITGLPAGIATATVVDLLGCTAIHNITLTEPEEIKCTPSADQVICIGTSATISVIAMGGTIPYTYHWSTGGNTSSVIVTPDSTTNYTCFVTDGNNCLGPVQTITVHILPPVNLEAICYEDICPDDSAKIFLQPSNGVAPYTLSLGDGTIISTPYYSHSKHTETIMFYVKDKCNIIDSAFVTVVVYPPPLIHIVADKYAGCSPLTINFHETSPNVGQSYVWNFDDDDENNLSLAKNPSHLFDVAGSYNVTLQVTTVNGCKKDTTLYNFINVFPLPDARFVYSPAIPTIVTPQVEFTNLSQGHIMNFWSFGDGDSSLQTNPDHIYKAIGDYKVILKVITDKGCVDTTIQYVHVQDYFSFYAPTAFSPDGDGKNDMFYVYGYGIMDGTFTLYLYDRWGEKIYESGDINAGWDGKVKGAKVQVGSYVWMVVCKDFMGNEKTAKGHVTVIR